MLRRLIQNWATSRRRKELDDFVLGLAGSDGSELGLLVAMATTIRNQFLVEGINLMSPAVLMATDSMAAYKLSSLCTKLQRSNQQHQAAGVMVWLHTLRAASEPTLRLKGREMWGHLEHIRVGVNRGGIPLGGGL